MSDPPQRITLIVIDETRLDETKPGVDWNYARSGDLHVAFLDSMDALRFAVRNALCDDALDIERVVIDRAGGAEKLLEFLASIPSEFAGDILFLRENGSGFLSATVRGGGRVLYQLSAQDVRFYLEMHKLVITRALVLAPVRFEATA